MAKLLIAVRKYCHKSFKRVCISWRRMTIIETKTSKQTSMPGLAHVNVSSTNCHGIIFSLDDASSWPISRLHLE